MNIIEKMQHTGEQISRRSAGDFLMRSDVYLPPEPAFVPPKVPEPLPLPVATPDALELLRPMPKMIAPQIHAHALGDVDWAQVIQAVGSGIAAAAAIYTTRENAKARAGAASIPGGQMPSAYYTGVRQPLGPPAAQQTPVWVWVALGLLGVVMLKGGL